MHIFAPLVGSFPAGAVEVLAAVCRGPRKDLRRLAARALGALGWDGKTEVRRCCREDDNNKQMLP